jgi:dihydrodipicolinate reductase
MVTSVHFLPTWIPELPRAVQRAIEPKAVQHHHSRLSAAPRGTALDLHKLMAIQLHHPEEQDAVHAAGFHGQVAVD